MKTNAILSDCRKYRFALWRIWDEARTYALFICMNPSTADETQDDPTIIRCMNYARSWGYGGMCMANLFAYRATNPEEMIASENPVGIGNDEWLVRLAKDAGIAVAAWGNNGAFLNRANQVTELISNLQCLKINKSGEPAHPLYLKAELRTIPFIRIRKKCASWKETDHPSGKPRRLAKPQIPPLV